jgi:hypothetical protein
VPEAAINGFNRNSLKKPIKRAGRIQNEVVYEISYSQIMQSISGLAGGSNIKRLS